MELKSNELQDSLIDMDARTFEGYAATWDKDQVDDVIQMGAFAKSINEAFPAKRIKVLWQHSQPLGMPVEMREDARGLYVKGKISKTTLGDEALELMRDGVVDRMSIGFIIPKDKSSYDPDTGIRYIKEVKLMEFSPVTFPANEAAVITGVKQIRQAIKNGAKIDDIKDLIQALDELKALIATGEPSRDTHKGYEPQEVSDILSQIKTLGGFALNLK